MSTSTKYIKLKRICDTKNTINSKKENAKHLKNKLHKH